MAAKVSAFTMLQYFKLINHRPIGFPDGFSAYFAGKII